jgi:hypothetical protein
VELSDAEDEEGVIALALERQHSLLPDDEPPPCANDLPVHKCALLEGCPPPILRAAPAGPASEDYDSSYGQREPGVEEALLLAARPELAGDCVPGSRSALTLVYVEAPHDEDGVPEVLLGVRAPEVYDYVPALEGELL